MKVAITGGSGFIGKLLVKKHIDLGDEVHVLSRYPEKYSDLSETLHIHIGDLSDLNSLEFFLQNVDVLYHCAAEIKNESLMQLINVEGTKNLIQAASDNIKHWVQLSSTGVYGPIHTGNINENQSYNTINEYERTKLESDFLVLDAAKKNKFTLTIIRPSNVFGFQMSNQSLFQLVKTVDKGLYFFVGTEGASANYVPVENVIYALYLGATKTAAVGKIYNISSWCTIEEFIGIIAQELNKPLPKYRVPINIIKFFARILQIIPKSPLTVARINALSNRAIYQTSKIEEELGYKPVVTTEQTLRDLVRFYKKNNGA